MQIRTILCPIDFTKLAARELDVAVEVGQALGARLVLHHNHGAIGLGLARAWDWESTHAGDDLSPVEAKRRMQEILNGLPPALDPEAVVTSGPIEAVLQALAEQLPADLIVLGSHGWSTPDHASITERLIADSPCPVLTFNEESAAAERFRLRPSGGQGAVRVVVPTDFSATAQHAVGYACALARVLPLQIELLHVLPPGGDRSPVAEDAALARLDAEVPADLVDRVRARVRAGRTVDEILAHLADPPATFAVLGEHTHELLRHFLTRDTTRAVVHAAPCPVWVVPKRAAL